MWTYGLEPEAVVGSKLVVRVRISIRSSKMLSVFSVHIDLVASIVAPPDILTSGDMEAESITPLTTTLALEIKGILRRLCVLGHRMGQDGASNAAQQDKYDGELHLSRFGFQSLRLTTDMDSNTGATFIGRPGG